MDRFLLIIVTLLIPTVFFTYPPIIEQSDGECSALQLRVERLASQDGAGRLTVSPLYGASSTEPGGAAATHNDSPLLPAGFGCAVAYWKTIVAGAPSMAQSPAQSKSAGDGPVAMIARDITPNGDPISPDTTFTLPMNTVAIRVDYPAAPTGAARFQLMAGGGVITSGPAQSTTAGSVWGRFNIRLGKGNYSITLTVNNALVGQFPFTVIGR